MLICALNPSLTQSLAAALYGEEAGAAQNSRTDKEAEAGLEQPSGEAPETAGADSGITDGADGAVTDGLVSSDGEGGYILPSDTELALPENVAGRNGYEPVKERKQEVPEEEADAWQTEPDTGETGENLTFDTLTYPYYGILKESIQPVYRQIYANAMQMEDSFSPVVSVNVNELKNVFEAVYNDHPEIFWLETGYSCKYLQNGRCIEITLQYNNLAENLQEEKQRFEAQAESILSRARTLGSDSEKEKYVHDALMEKADYDTGADINQSAYSALVNGKTVCAGYARAFQYLIQQLNIPCYYCTGYSGEDHAWNIIRLGQEYYNVDVTWDDTNPATYNYYNKSDSEFADTHVRRSLSVYLPACNAAGTTDETQGSATADNGGRTDANDGRTDAAGTVDSGEDLDGTEDFLVNPNPREPITWHSTWNDTEDPEERSAEEKLEEAGITADEVLDTMETYYADCLEQMKAVGAGAKQFTNVVPESLWNSIERVYTDNSFQKGYVEAALKELKMENFAIQLQAQRLGGGYYRLYHNVSTW